MQLPTRRQVIFFKVDLKLEVLSRHGWYTAQSTVVFSLFSNKLSADEKSRVAARILTFEPPEKVKLGKPDFKELEKSTKIEDLVGPGSYLFFSILGAGWQWLNKDPAQWREDPDYKELADFVRTVKVTNDTAEKGNQAHLRLLEDLDKGPSEQDQDAAGGGDGPKDQPGFQEVNIEQQDSVVIVKVSAVNITIKKLLSASTTS